MTSLPSLLRVAEKRFAVFALIFFTGALECASLVLDSDPGKNSIASPPASPLAPLITFGQYTIYAITSFLLLARFKSVVIPAFKNIFVWLLVLMALASVFWSDSPADSQRYGLLTFFTSLFGLYLASRYSLKEQLRMVALAFVITAIFTLLYSLTMPGFAIESGANAGAWRGPFVQKNIMGRAMVLGAMAILLVGLNTGRGYLRYLIWSGFSLSVLLIVISSSKSGLLIFFVLVFFVPLYRSLRWSNSLAIPFFIVLLLIGGSLAVFITENFESIVIGLGKDPSLSGRTYIWEAVINKILERPWLGYGYAAFWSPDGAAADVWLAVGDKPPHAHNGFINLGADFGFLGLSFYVLSLVTAYRRAVAWVRATNTTEDLWPLLYVTFLFLYNQTESTIIGYNSIFWVSHVAVALSLKPGRVLNYQVSIEQQEALTEHV